MIRCENYTVLKMDMRIPYRNSIKGCVIIEDNEKWKLYIIKNQYVQVHIGTLSQDK